eukprot:1002899-Rhodomonas_salina.2
MERGKGQGSGKSVEVGSRVEKRIEGGGRQGYPGGERVNGLGSRVEGQEKEQRQVRGYDSQEREGR